MNLYALKEALVYADSLELTAAIAQDKWSKAPVGSEERRDLREHYEFDRAAAYGAFQHLADVVRRELAREPVTSDMARDFAELEREDR